MRFVFCVFELNLTDYFPYLNSETSWVLSTACLATHHHFSDRFFEDHILYLQHHPHFPPKDWHAPSIETAYHLDKHLCLALHAFPCTGLVAALCPKHYHNSSCLEDHSGHHSRFYSHFEIAEISVKAAFWLLIRHSILPQWCWPPASLTLGVLTPPICDNVGAAQPGFISILALTSPLSVWLEHYPFFFSHKVAVDAPAFPTVWPESAARPAHLPRHLLTAQTLMPPSSCWKPADILAGTIWSSPVQWIILSCWFHPSAQWKHRIIDVLDSFTLSCADSCDMLFVKSVVIDSNRLSIALRTAQTTGGVSAPSCCASTVSSPFNCLVAPPGCTLPFSCDSLPCPSPSLCSPLLLPMSKYSMNIRATPEYICTDTNN